MQDDQLTALQLENARLISLLESHGIEWRLPPPPAPAPEPEPSRLSTAEKVALFRRLFRETLNNSIFHDPSSVFLVRWEKKAIFGA